MKITSPPHRRGAFSLVEITLALGITSFSMIAILGLSAVSLKQTGESRSDLYEAMLVQGVRAQLASIPWADLTGSSGGSGLPYTFYFSLDGAPVATAAAADWQVVVTDTAGTVPGLPADASAHLLTLRLDVRHRATGRELSIPVLMSQYE